MPGCFRRLLLPSNRRLEPEVQTEAIEVGRGLPHVLDLERRKREGRIGSNALAAEIAVQVLSFDTPAPGETDFASRAGSPARVGVVKRRRVVFRPGRPKVRIGVAGDVSESQTAGSV